MQLSWSTPPSSSRLPPVACPSVRPLSVQCRNVAVTRAISVVVVRLPLFLPFSSEVRGGAESGASHHVAGSEFLSLARPPARARSARPLSKSRIKCTRWNLVSGKDASKRERKGIALFVVGESVELKPAEAKRERCPPIEVLQ